MFFVEDNKPESIADGIEKALRVSDDDRKTMTDRAREYLIENKTWEKQVGRMVGFIVENMKMIGV